MTIPGEQVEDSMLSLQVPLDLMDAPTGRYAFTIDVCEWRPPCFAWDPRDSTRCLESAVKCGECVPESCRFEPIEECSEQLSDGCYVWYDSEDFHLRLLDEE